MDGDIQRPSGQGLGSIARELDRNEIVIGARNTVRDWDIHRRIVYTEIRECVCL